MFNRKITSESFDDSLDSFEDFLQDPLTSKEFLNKSGTNYTSSVDVETGEVLSTPQRASPNQKTKQSQSSAKSVRIPLVSQNVPTTFNSSLFISLGFSLIFSLVVGSVGYFVFSSEFSRLSSEVIQTSAKVSDLDKSFNHLQTTISTNDETEEVLDLLEILSSDLESVENILQSHLHNANKHGFLPKVKKTSPIDSLKNVTYLGSFGGSNQSVAFVSILDEKKELKTGQLLFDTWQLTSIQPNQITFTHPSGLIHSVARKKSSF